MGAPNYYLVPPAILLDNPSIGFNDFMGKLNGVRCSAWWTCKTNAPYKSWGRRKFGSISRGLGEHNSFHAGRYGLAEWTLHLPLTEQFKKKYPSSMDCNGVVLNPPWLEIIPRNDGGNWIDPSFRMHIHTGNKILESKIIEGLWSACRLSAGDVSSDEMTSEDFIVDEILRERKERSRKDDDVDTKKWSYNLKVRTFDCKYKQLFYKNEKELVSDWPDFAFDARYDLNTISGVLSPSSPSNVAYTNVFFWKQRNGFYSLDERTFDLIKVDGGRGFTDLVVTAEVVKKKAWKFLCYNGGRFIQQFLSKNPDSDVRHQKAVGDSWLSKYAREKGLSNSDLIRLSLDLRRSYSPLPKSAWNTLKEEEKAERQSHDVPTPPSEKDKTPFG